MLAPTLRVVFRVSQVETQQFSDRELLAVTLDPVVDPRNETEAWPHTPAGRIRLDCVKPELAESYAVGQLFGMELTAVAQAEPAKAVDPAPQDPASPAEPATPSPTPPANPPAS